MAAKPPAYGAVRRTLGLMTDWFMGKQAVGKDAMGNVYYKWYEGSGADRTERREVQWASEHMYYDPKDCPAEWRMWLRKIREEPPTDAEMVQSAAKAAALQAKVAALEETERLRRQRQESVGMPDMLAGVKLDMSLFLQQVAGKERPVMKRSGAAPGTAASEATAAAPTDTSGGGGGGGAKKPAAGGGDFKPDAWRPGK